MKKILVVGGVSIDTIIHLDRLPEGVPQTLFAKATHQAVGSTGAGKALNLNRLGFEVTLHAMIGDDAPGRLIRENFERENLRFLYDVDPKGTEQHVNLMDGEGGRISIYTNAGTFEPEVDLVRLESLIAETDILVVNILNYCRQILPLAKRRHKEIWCDIHDYDGKNPYHQDFIEAADYLFMSADAMPDYRDFMRRMIEAGKKLVVCTRGKEGAVLATPPHSQAHGEGSNTAFEQSPRNNFIEMAAIRSYPVVDTNGAGDSFFAGYLYGYEQGYAAEKCSQLATIAGGLCVSSRELVHPAMSTAKLEAEYRVHYEE